MIALGIGILTTDEGLISGTPGVIGLIICVLVFFVWKYAKKVDD